MASESELEVTFTVTDEDVLWVQRRSLFYDHRVAVWLTYPILVGPIAYVLGRFDSKSAAVGVVLALTLILTFILWLLPRWFTAYWARKARGFSRTSTLAITPEGVRTVGDRGEEFILWTDCPRIVSTRPYLLIYLQTGAIFPIPTRSFDSPAAAQRFQAAARTWHQRALAEQPHRVTLGPAATGLLSLVVLLLCITVFPIIGLLVPGVVLGLLEALANFELPRDLGVNLMFMGAVCGFLGGVAIAILILRTLNRRRVER